MAPDESGLQKPPNTTFAVGLSAIGGLYSSTRFASLSAMKTSPALSTVTPNGPHNELAFGPLLISQMFCVNLPSWPNTAFAVSEVSGVLNLSTRLLLKSAT
jgi:hypothetical protein